MVDWVGSHLFERQNIKTLKKVVNIMCGSIPCVIILLLGIPRVFDISFLISFMTYSRLAPEPKKKDNSAPSGLPCISTISVHAIKSVAGLVVVQ